MRLIDADKMKETVAGQGIAPILRWIDSQHTVEAIPIDWINKYLEKKYPHESTKMIEDMVSDWEYRDDL